MSELKEGSRSGRYVMEIGHEGRSGTFGLQGSKFTTNNQAKRLMSEHCVRHCRLMMVYGIVLGKAKTTKGWYDLV